MLYHSTRSRNRSYTAKEAILQGLCEDGGLFVSDELGNEKLNLAELTELSYEELALRVFSLLLPDFTQEELKKCIASAYAGKFETEELTPLSGIGDRYLLELYHGPTQAFKDLALCMLPQFMSAALAENSRKVMILTATSGDTGKAALAGFAGAENIGITVFYPHGKVSDIQYLQMAAQQGKNVFVSGVEGNFDDCQSGVKEIFEKKTAEIRESTGVMLSSANSINIGRLVPQVVYYFESYKQLVRRGVLRLGEPLEFCVPTGNFGDVLAGFYAKLLGLPVGKLIVASNENRVLYDFITTGTYDRNREFVKTISPSMDILISSNLERLLYYVSGCSCEEVAELMDSLKRTGKFTASETVMKRIREVFDCGYADNGASKEAIREAWEKDGRLIDPHTAVGYRVSAGRKGCVLLSTASPFKFARDVCEALGIQEDLPDGFACMEALTRKTGVPAPEALLSLKNAEVLHKSVVLPEEMAGFAEAAVRSGKF